MKRWIALLAVCLAGLMITPVVAQQVVRIYGTESGGTFLPVLVDSLGRVLVDLSGGSVTPTTVLVPASTCASPALGEQGATTTGIAFTTTPSILDCVSGTARTTLTASVFTSTVPIAGPAGSLANPTFEVEPSTGIYSTGDGIGAFSANGTSVATWNSDGTFRLVATRAFSLASRAFINTAPTVTSAGTSPSVIASNGSAAFTVNVGTGGAATTIVMAMPTATTGWLCSAENLTAAAANRANQTVKQQSSTTTAVTVQNQTVSTGAALAFTASDTVAFQCTAY